MMLNSVNPMMMALMAIVISNGVMAQKGSDSEFENQSPDPYTAIVTTTMNTPTNSASSVSTSSASTPNILTNTSISDERYTRPPKKLSSSSSVSSSTTVIPEPTTSSTEPTNNPAPSQMPDVSRQEFMEWAMKWWAENYGNKS